MGIYDPKTGKTNISKVRKKKSFADIGNNLNIVARRLMQNEALLRLLVHTSKDAETMELTQSQREEVFGDQIKIVPVIDKDEEIKNYIVIQFGAFTPVGEDNMYKNYVISFDIICNVNNWMLKDYTPRPYKIMAEIDEIIADTKIDSLGPVQFLAAQNLIINEEMSGFTLSYMIMSET